MMLVITRAIPSVSQLPLQMPRHPSNTSVSTSKVAVNPHPFKTNQGD